MPAEMIDKPNTLGSLTKKKYKTNKYIRSKKEDKTIVTKNSKSHYKIYKMLSINFQIQMKRLIFPAQYKLSKIDSRKTRLSEHINNHTIYQQGFS